MSTVVNLKEFDKRFSTLGWAISDVNVRDFLTNHPSIGAAEVVAYLDALIAAPTGLNDQTIAGCPAADATVLTNGLKNIGVVLT